MGIRRFRFLKAINKVFQQTGVNASLENPVIEKAEPAKEPYLYFRTDRKTVKVMINEIIYIEGMKNYIRIITEKGIIITKNSMAAAEAMLPAEAFLRVHRSYIVLKSKIKSFTHETIDIGSAEIPIGKLFKNEVIKALHISH